MVSSRDVLQRVVWKEVDDLFHWRASERFVERNDSFSPCTGTEIRCRVSGTNCSAPIANAALRSGQAIRGLSRIAIKRKLRRTAGEMSVIEDERWHGSRSSFTSCAPHLCRVLMTHTNRNFSFFSLFALFFLSHSFYSHHSIIPRIPITQRHPNRSQHSSTYIHTHDIAVSSTNYGNTNNRRTRSHTIKHVHVSDRPSPSPCPFLSDPEQRSPK